MANDKRMAVLIDADNVSPGYIKDVFAEVVNHGTPTIKRIYGDWTRPDLSGWKDKLLEYSINPMQQYAYTSGKNSTDSALIIDAMDILYAGNVEGFCIVSSDSDFTKLASRLRESGMYVVGLGERKTPRPFVQSCEKFLYLESLSQVDEQPKKPATNGEARAERKWLVDQIHRIVSEQANEGGWVLLSEVGRLLNKRFPDFDARNYGHKKLSTLAESLEEFEIRAEGDAPDALVKNYYIRVREGRQRR